MKEFNKDQFKLKTQYRLLSELEDLFPKNSKHKAFIEIQKKMHKLLTQIKTKL